MNNSDPAAQLMQWPWPPAIALQATHAAAQFDPADLVAGGPNTTAELAAAVHADPGALARSLRARASLGLFASASFPAALSCSPKRFWPPRPQTDSALMDLLMLVLCGGRERTEADFRSLLDSAGFPSPASSAPAPPRCSNATAWVACRHRVTGDGVLAP